LLTLASAAGAVVGSMLVHADGIDFVVLTPTWLAVSLFVALPAAFAVGIAVAVERVRRADSWTAQGRTRWLLPLLLLLPFPPAWFVTGIAAAVLVVWVVVRDTEAVRSIGANRWVGLAIRGVWLAVAILGLVTLLSDIDQLQAVT
jgi:hypothetical protein